MNNIKRSNLKTVLILTAIAGLYSSCSEEDMPLNEMGHFPLKDGTTWKYEEYWKSFGYYLSDGEYIEPVTWSVNQFTIRIEGDSTIKGRRYKKLINEHGFTDKLIRKVGTKYYMQNYRSLTRHEYEDLKFLDEGLAGEGKWSYILNERVKIEFHQSTKKQLTVNGKTFWNVKVVTVKEYYDYGRSNTYNLMSCPIVKYFYAPGVGEIQVLEDGCYGDRETMLLDNN